MLHERFDLSDAGAAHEVDRLDAVLDVAVTVLRDYGPDPGSTRIERMARWLALNVGGAVQSIHGDDTSVWTVGDALSKTGYAQVFRAGMLLALDAKKALTPQEARDTAIALLRAAELAEA